MPWTREQMAAQAARELQDGFYGNLGIGIPPLVANFVPIDIEVVLQSENGMLGIGPFPYDDEVDPDLLNAGKQTITTLPTSSFFSSADSLDRKSTRLNSSHYCASRMPSHARKNKYLVK